MSLEATADEACPYCGEDFYVDVLDVFSEERTFMLDTCCEGIHEEAVEELNDPGADRRAFAGWFADCTGYRVRRAVADDSGAFDNAGISLDWGLRLESIKLKDAKAWIRKHHRHNAPPVSWRWGHAVYNGPDLIGVAMVGRPVARMLDHTRIVEVNRLCVDPSVPGWMVWNACSMMYGAAVKEARARGFERVITYTLETESGGSLKASGFEPVAKTKGGSWNRDKRKRTDKAPTTRKTRWERRT